MAEAAIKAGANQAPFKPPSAIVDSSAMNMKLICEANADSRGNAGLPSDRITSCIYRRCIARHHACTQSVVNANRRHAFVASVIGE